MISFHFLNKYFSIILAPNRSNPYAYDNRVFHTETPNNLLRPIKDTNIYEHVSTTHSPRPPSQMSEIEAGRTKLHRLLDEVLDKAEPSPTAYDPDSEAERQRRRRQRRRGPSITYGLSEPLVANTTIQMPHVPMTPNVSQRPDPSVLQHRYKPYEAGDRVNAIQRANLVELRPKYASDDHDIQQRYSQMSYRSNPPLYHDDLYNSQTRQSNIRPHRFDNDTVYIDTLRRNRDDIRPQIHSNWSERPTQSSNNDNYFHLNASDLNQHNYHNEYMLAKQSVVNTKHLLSSIQDELQHIVVQPSIESYHA